MDNLFHQKEQLRKENVRKFQHVSAAERRNADEAIRLRLFALPSVASAQTICTYVSLPDEVDTIALIHQLLQTKKAVIVPRIASNNEVDLCAIGSLEDLSSGVFNIREPKKTCPKVKARSVELFIIPGVVFDRNGNRLGRGRGYYDRLLKDVTVPKIALAYDAQVIAQVPHSSYDVPVSKIVTEKETISA